MRGRSKPPAADHARRVLMAAIDKIAKNARAKAPAAVVEHVNASIDFVMLLLQEKPDGYFAEKLSAADAVDSAAQEVWKEISHEVVKKAFPVTTTTTKGVN